MNFQPVGEYVNPGPVFIICFNCLNLALIAGLGLLPLCWSSVAAGHSTKETPRVLPACGFLLVHFLQVKLGVSKSHSNIQILISDRLCLRFTAVHHFNHIQEEAAIAVALEAMPVSLVFLLFTCLTFAEGFFAVRDRD